ncbi:hypothetical protein YC2023_014581 [Brassica napus]
MKEGKTFMSIDPSLTATEREVQVCHHRGDTPRETTALWRRATEMRIPPRETPTASSSGEDQETVAESSRFRENEAESSRFRDRNGDSSRKRKRDPESIEVSRGIAEPSRFESRATELSKERRKEDDSSFLR